MLQKDINEISCAIEQNGYTVSQISQLIKGALETNFSDIIVHGEISEIVRAKSGHVYFTIKDESSTLSVICWRDVFNTLNIKLDIGLEVICGGKISSYPLRSNYQFIINKIKISGDGTLLKLFEERKQKLEKMGVFDEKHKKSIPKFPSSICVVTSEKGAVIKDIVSRISKRYPMQVYIYHCQVQGAEAHLEVSYALKALNSLDNKHTLKPDAIIIARGGGSAQDLWPFNEEELALAIYDSKIPIISAVGHETDFTLCDFAADLRAPTPTAAAEIATPDRTELIRYNRNLTIRIYTSVANRMQSSHYQLNYACGNFAKQLHEIDIQAAQIKHLFKMCKYLVESRINVCYTRSVKLRASLILRYFEVERLIQKRYSSSRLAVFNRLAYLQEHVQGSFRVIDSMNPQKVLDRGYALVKQSGAIVSSKKNFIKSGVKTTIQFKDGEVEF